MLVSLIRNLLLFYPWNFCLFAYFIKKIFSWPIYHIGISTIYNEPLKTFFLLDTLSIFFLTLSIFWSLSLTSWKYFFIYSLPGVLFFWLFFMYFNLVFFMMTIESHLPGSQKLWMLIQQVLPVGLIYMHLLTFSSLLVF